MMRMGYDENTCYWCGKKMKEGDRCFSSLATDTIKTMRNFCSAEHLELFKKHAKADIIRGAGMYHLKPYYGKKGGLKNESDRN
jgi:hypothetical protein